MNAQVETARSGLPPLTQFVVEMETQRRQIEMAKSIVDACRLANDSMLIPMFARPEPEEEDAEEDAEREKDKDDAKETQGRSFPPEPDLEGALAMVWMILNNVSESLETLMIEKFEERVDAGREKTNGEEEHA